MADVKFEFNDYRIEVMNAIENKINNVLEECAGELESQVKRNSRVKTSKTKNSFQHKVVDSEHAAYIGSSEENAIWEEFGTGEYALNGDGRKGGWVYKNENVKLTKSGRADRRFKNNNVFVFTYGKKPSRAFWNAYVKKKDKIIKHIQDAFKEL